MKTGYTFTFAKEDLKRFNSILSNLNDDDYELAGTMTESKNEKTFTTECSVRYLMDSETALNFRMGMKKVNIRRDRTEEELAEEARIKEERTIHVTVRMPPEDMAE